MSFRPAAVLSGVTVSSLGLFFLGFGGSKSEGAAAPVSGPPSPGGMSYPPPNNGKGRNNSSVPAPVGSNSVVRPAEFFKYGFPGPVHDMETREEFVSVYDRAKRNPYYVVEHITPESLKKVEGNGDRKNSVFKEDEAIPLKFRALLKDYFRSGYDRGHQAPAADAKFSQNAMDETFYLTNMSPQVGAGFNREYWAYFEDFARRLTGKYPSVRVVTGPLYLPKKGPDGKFRVTYEVIGNPPSIAVPTHFFKLIVAEKPNTDEISVAAFVLPNEVIPNEIPLSSFEVPIEALERSSGLEFLKNVPLYKQRPLCKEFQCSIVVREFLDSGKQKKPALPAPRN